MEERGQGIEPNVRSAWYSIVESQMRCPQCDRVTAVFAFALPADYESFTPEEDTPEDREGVWESPGFAAVLSYVGALAEAVITQVRALTAHYRFDPDDSYWRNHCEHCGRAVPEEALHEDLDGPFGPLSPAGDALVVHRVRGPFEALAGVQAHDVKDLQG
jgi:hypothetical protein